MWSVSMRLACLAIAILCTLPFSHAFECRMDPTSMHPFCGLPYELSNFQGYYKCDAKVAIGRPKSIEQLKNLVINYEKVKAVGVGHSWWREQFCPSNDEKGIGITLTELEETQPVFSLAKDAPKAIVVNEETQTVDVAAGVPQRTLLIHLAKYKTQKAPQGYTLASFTWFIDQTIGGAVATASHGSTLRHGGLQAQTTALQMMLANGTVVTIDNSNPHLFNAAKASIGRLGILLRLTMKIVPQVDVQRKRVDISVDDWVKDMKDLQARYNKAKATGDTTQVWEAIKEYDETQMFWHYSLDTMWKVMYKRLDGSSEQMPSVEASDDGHLPGAFDQKFQEPVGTTLGIEANPKTWARFFQVYIMMNVQDGVYPASTSYQTMSELQNKWHAPYNAYDQYEVAIPLSRVGDCLNEVIPEVYGSKKLWEGTRSPALVRFVGVNGGGDTTYLAPDNGEPHMYINMEDYVSRATKKENKQFQEIINLFRTSKSCKARLHWGKAGWPNHATCFDGATEYPNTWCHFGCAVQQLDPNGKFSSTASVWRWNAKTADHDLSVPLDHCCTPQGFDSKKCVCAKRTGCL